MSNISKIDKNFKIETKIDKADIKFYDVKSGIFDVYGLYKFYETDKYCRMDPVIADSLKTGVAALNWCTAGGRIRFKTNSRYVAINRNLVFFKDGGGKSPHFTVTGSSGYDIYLVENGQQLFYKSFMPEYDFDEHFEQVIDFEDDSERDIIIHMPLYNGCSAMYIGLQESAYIKAGSPYKYDKPILFYGSSITQGGCASRPGNAYTNMLSRFLDADHINLGFAGNAKGEDTIAEYIADIDCSVFVYDYDHNAPNAEHLRNTHEKMFLKFREKHPNTPVVMMSRPTLSNSKTVPDARTDVIIETYNRAKNRGDNNVYFVDGRDLFSNYGGSDCTVDGCHPTDLGFFSMAKCVEKVILDNKLL